MKVKVKRLNGNGHYVPRVEKAESILQVIDARDPAIGDFFRSFGLPQNWFHLSERSLAEKIDDMVNPYSQHAWIYAAVSAKARDIMSVPFKVYLGKQADGDEPMEADRVAMNDPLQKVFHEPWPGGTGEELQEAMSIHLDLCGEFIWVLVSDIRTQTYRKGEIPKQIWPIWPKLMEHKVQNGKIYKWILKLPNGETEEFPADQVLHVRLHNPYDAYRGLSPIDAAGLDANTDWKAGRFTEALIDNGGEPGGILSTDLDLKPHQIQEVRGQWADRHEGKEKAGRVAVLTGGLRYQATGVTQKDMQWSELRHWAREAILACIGVPELVVGLAKDVNRTTATAVKRIYWQDNLIPRLKMIERAIFTKLLSPVTKKRGPRGGRVYFGLFDLNRVEALKEDLSEKLKQALSLQKLGYGCNHINKRLRLDMPEVPWGDEPLTSPNQVPITLIYDDPTVGLPQAAPAAEPAPRALIQPPSAAPAPSPGAGRRFLPPPKFSSQGTRLFQRREVADAYRRQIAHAAESAMESACNTYFAVTRQAQMNAFASFRRNRGTSSTIQHLDAAAYRDLPPDSPLTAADIELILLAPHRFAAAMTSVASRILPTAAVATLEFLSEELNGFSVITPDLTSPWIRKQITQRLAELVKVAKADRLLIRKAIISAITNHGMTDISSVQKYVGEVMGRMPHYRSLRIARTEMGMLGNSIRYEAMEREEVKEHEWSTANDAHVRPSTDKATIKKIGKKGNKANHRVLDGQVRKIGEPFSNGLLYPLDPAGDASEVVACRCIALAVV